MALGVGDTPTGKGSGGRLGSAPLEQNGFGVFTLAETAFPESN